MTSALFIGLLSFVGFILSYRLYGKWLGQYLFQLTVSAPTPAVRINDASDFVPSNTGILFGHHFTSIAGTGPIVGPAIGVIWGWLPAFVWVVFGSILMGAVHDLGTLVLSMRHDGRSISDIADHFLPKPTRLFMVIIVCIALWIVIAIFGLIIAIIFRLFPESVIPVWFEIPIALFFGFAIRRFSKFRRLITWLALLLMTTTVVIGHMVPIQLNELYGLPVTGIWTICLLFYAAIASICPVHVLLQPRDYLNAWQLWFVMGSLSIGCLITGLNGTLQFVSPVIELSPSGAPSMVPFLFITIACGAISGFHSLVASGTTSKQIKYETDAVSIGYGSMVLEGALAVIIIIVCCAGIGIGYPTDAGLLTGADAWRTHYASWEASAGLASKLEVVVIGSANIMNGCGLPHHLGVVIMGVFIASFAGTTLDTSTRLQRYMISELLPNRLNTSVVLPTLVAVSSAGILAFSSGMSGNGALQLWPMFGAMNQLLACLGLGMVTLYVKRINPSYWLISGLPFLFMCMITAWAIIQNQRIFLQNHNWLLVVLNAGMGLLGFSIIVIAILKRLVRRTL